MSSLNAAGASFPAKVYQSWFADLAGSGGIKVNYQAVGSGSGRKAFIDGTVDFAASDDPIKEADRKQVSQGVVQIPMVGGTIAFGYNKPGCELQLTQQQAVEVATGGISDWKELGCEAGTITWVHRSDGSGTTKAFADSMQAFSTDWTLGSGKSVKWPVGVGAKGNSGVAGVIDNRVGAIGYVNQSYIKGHVQAAAQACVSDEEKRFSPKQIPGVIVKIKWSMAARNALSGSKSCVRFSSHMSMAFTSVSCCAISSSPVAAPKLKPGCDTPKSLN